MDDEELRGEDLRGGDLRGGDLRGGDLRGGDLRGEDLRGGDLRGGDPRGADLRGADLRGGERSSRGQSSGPRSGGLPIEWLGIAATGFLLIGFGWRLSVVEARPLAFPTQFTAKDPECRQIAAFVAEVNRACAAGDVGALVGRLTPSYHAALAAQLRHLGRALDADTLRAMVALLPEVTAATCVSGASRGDRVAVVVQQRDIAFRAGVAEEFCLTCLPLAWDGSKFRLGRPEWRHVAGFEVAATARSLAESWFSAEAPGKNSAAIATDSWPTTSRR
jgi:hypothetical protein